MDQKPTYEELVQRVKFLENQAYLQNELKRRSLDTEALYRLMLDNISDTVIITDDQGNIIYVCPNKTEIFELSQEQIYNQKNIQCLLNGTVCDIATIKRQQKIENIEWSITTSSGKEHHILISMKLVNLLNGGTVLYVIRDNTERKHTEDAFRENVRYLDNIINKIADLIFVKNRKHKWVLLNDALCQFMGHNRDDLLGKSDYDIFPKEEADVFWKKDELVFTSGKENINEETITNAKGDVRKIVTKKTLYTDEKNEQYIVGIISDITDRVSLEEQLRQAVKMEAVGTLAGGVAHEFNNMLAIIMGNSELIMEELPQGNMARESAEEILVAGLRARDVVKQLLTFSRQSDAVDKVMDLKFVVQESIKLIRSSTPTNIKIEQNVSGDIYPVMGNVTQINQILINLCNNAVDSLPEKGGILTIELLNETIDKVQTKQQIKLKRGQYVKLMVSDNGIGMDNETLDKVFEPYFTTKAIGEGTGIGMAIVHGIVERHGGTILVESQPSHGTTFTIFLPAYEGLFDQETDERDILPVGDECILYVDDEPSIAKLGQRLLESLGYTTIPITDPEKALEVVTNNPNKFDLLITDMAMPNMTGDKLVIEAIKIRQDMPSIICTGYSAKISEEEAANIGAHAYIMKPINKSELAKLVRKVLDGAKRSSVGNIS